MIKNKDEIRLFYETHDLSPRAVANKFKMSYRTLAHWIRTENWEVNKCSKILDSQTIQNKVVQTKIYDVLDITKKNIKRDLYENLGDYKFNLDKTLLDNMLDSSTEEILLQAMSLNFIQKNQVLAAMLAKDELMRLNAARGNDEPNAMFIACAEKVHKIFADLQTSIHGKDCAKRNDNLENQNVEELNELELAELAHNELARPKEE